MNYRHIYHAGNICDVVKHAVLALLIGHLRAKDKGFCVLDTHAGIGFYDLSDPRAEKTNEADEGIRRLWNAAPHPLLADYMRIVREMNPDGSLRFYPGSPLLTRRLLRPQDRLVACELHPDDIRELKRRFAEDPQAHLHHRDGYAALKALLPPPEKRGLVFIDPPFESPDEFTRLAEAVATIHKRWPQGQIAIWYPIKERPAIWRFHESLIALNIPKIMVAEFLHAEETRHDRLNGSGFILVNAPWGVDKTLHQLFLSLPKALEMTYSREILKSLSD